MCEMTDIRVSHARSETATNLPMLIKAMASGYIVVGQGRWPIMQWYNFIVPDWQPEANQQHSKQRLKMCLHETCVKLHRVHTL